MTTRIIDFRRYKEEDDFLGHLKGDPVPCFGNFQGSNDRKDFVSFLIEKKFIVERSSDEMTFQDMDTGEEMPRYRPGLLPPPYLVLKPFRIDITEEFECDDTAICEWKKGDVLLLDKHNRFWISELEVLED